MILLAWLGFAAVTQASQGRQNANNLWLRGLDYQAEFQFDSARLFFNRAIEADAEFLPAHLSKILVERDLGSAVGTRAEYERRKGSSPFHQCVNVIAWGLSGHDIEGTTPRYRELIRSQGRTPCSEVAKIWSKTDNDVRPALILAAIQRYGNSPTLAAEYAAALRRKNQQAGSFDLFKPLPAASSRALEFDYRSESLRALRVSADKAVWSRSFEAFVRDFSGDRRPYLQWKILEFQKDFLPQGVNALANLVQHNNAMRKIARRYNARAYEIELYVGEGTLAIEVGALSQAVQALNAAVSLAASTGSIELLQRPLHYRGRALAAQGKSSAAVADLKRTAFYARSIGERYRLADAYHQMAHAYEATGNWDQAMAAADSFVRIGANVPYKNMRMIRLSDAAAIQWKAGFHGRSIELYEEMVRVIEQDSLNYEYAGAYFERTGELGRALGYYRKVIANPMSGSSKLAFAGLARVHEHLGSFDSAVANAKKHDALVMTPEREILLPRLLARQGRLADAERQAKAWVAVQVERGNPGALAAAINQQAEIILAADPGKAIPLLERAESIARSVNSRDDITAARRLRGLALAADGKTNEAVNQLSSALAMARKDEDVFIPLAIEADIANTHLAAGRLRSALSWYLRAYQSLQLVTVNFEDPVLVARFREARSGIFNGAARAAMRLPMSERPAKLLEWSRRKKGSPMSTVFSATMRDNEIVLDYLVMGDSIAVTVLSRGKPASFVLPVGAAQVAEAGRKLVGPMREARNGNIDIARTPFSFATAKFLYDVLLRPIEPALESTRRVTVIPDVSLQLVPFDALVVREGSGAETYSATTYAGEKWMFSYAPTLDAATSRSSAQSFALSSLLLIAHSAPGVEREENVIRATWATKRTRALTKSAASENSLHPVPAGSIVHFATHAVSNEVDPLASHLVLAVNTRSDGLLQAKEIRKADWAKSLVVLSACETAAGPAFSGSGTFSLARAFLDGGASTVIATQWPVGPASATMAAGFYRELSRNSSPVEALYRARKVLRTDPATAHPFFWASYVLIQGRR